MTKRLELIDAGRFRLQGSDWSHCRWRLLAEGDSWFSLGSLNPLTSANLLESMRFAEFAAAVHCSYPGDTLRRMVDIGRDPNFDALLAGRISWRWDAILLSAGGNDLIDAVQTRTDASADRRLLLRSDEWGPQSDGPRRYVSEDGWRTFASYIEANLDQIVALRDRKAGETGNRGRPICMHTYAYPTPRPAGAGLGQGPWLLPGMLQYAIPKQDWTALARLLLDRLGDLLLACAADQARYPQLHVFDSRRVAVEPALPDTTGISGDWVNEIHLTRQGCDKVASAWSREVQRVMEAHP